MQKNLKQGHFIQPHRANQTFFCFLLKDTIPTANNTFLLANDTKHFGQMGMHYRLTQTKFTYTTFGIITFFFFSLLDVVS